MARLTLDWVQLAAILGALQGLVLTAVLASQRSNRTANRLLAALMATFTIYLAAGPYYTTGAVRAFPWFFGISYHTTWLFGPLVYLYARAASDRSWRLTPKQFVHFVPAAVTIILAIPIYAMSGEEKVVLAERWMTGGADFPLRLIDPLKYVSGIAYSVATVLYLVRHRRVIEQGYSNIARVNLRWLLWLSAAAGGIWLLATGLWISQVSTSLRDGHITFAMALLVYGIGYLGLRQPEILRYETAEPRAVENATPRYERSGLSDREAEQLGKSLVHFMEHAQPWKDSELTLADLAAQLDSTPHKLSEVVNTEIGQTFYDFVNGYRVREVQRRIKAGEARSLKMLALAMDAGFASKSTFNQVFKKHTSQTPSDFRQAVGA